MTVRRRWAALAALALLVWGAPAVVATSALAASAPATPAVVDLRAPYQAALGREMPRPVRITYARGHGPKPTPASTLPVRHVVSGCADSSCPLVYQGGSVQHDPKVFLLLWGPDWSTTGADATYLGGFLAGLGAEPTDTWSTTTDQYSDSTGHPSYTGSVLAGVWQDRSVPPSGASQTQLGAEADAFYAAQGLTDPADTQIVVATQSGTCPVGFYAPGCAGGSGYYCAWHSYSSAQGVPYTNLPYLLDSGTGCGEDYVNVNGTFDGFSIVEGHEFAETVTDPFIDAWLDGGGYEIGDKCAWIDLADITLPSGSYAVQPLWSNDADDCVLATPVPGQPTGVEASEVGDGVGVSWSAPASGAAPVTSYTVSAQPGGPTEVVSGNPPPTRATVTGLTDGSTYTFTVSAYHGPDPGATSAPSVPVTPRGLPGAPTGATATLRGPSRATLAWAAPTNVGSSALTGYEVSRDGTDANGHGPWSRVVGPGQLSQTFTSLVQGDTYDLCVQALNAKGAGPSACASVAIPTVAPTVPTDVTASMVTGTEAMLSWAPPAEPGAAPISGYVAGRNGVDSYGSGPWSTTVAATKRSQTFTRLVPGATYVLTVEALNPDAAGPAAAVTVTVPRAVPSAPLDVSAALVAATQALLSWAPPASPGASAITAYTVGRNGTDAHGHGPWSATIPATKLSQAFTALVPGDTYVLTVRAVNAEGTGPPQSTTVAVPAGPG